MIRVPDRLAEMAADLLVGPVLSGPVQTCYCCPCGCKQTRSAFNCALDYARLGLSPRNAVENVAEHFSLSPEAFEQLVDDVEYAIERPVRL